ncbi:MAG: hypothetical protein AB7O65_00910 [Candidatus Korobacteraceae bacterium]
MTLESLQRFKTEQWVAAETVRVFHFFADPRNLPAITPPRSGARVVSLKLVAPPEIPETKNGPGLAGAGSEIVISVRPLPWLPFRSRWRARITRFEYGAYFEDEQASGPFQLWHHRHEFQTEKREAIQGTIIRDIVNYQVGFGPVGQLADLLMVRRALRQMFQFRHGATERAFTDKG